MIDAISWIHNMRIRQKISLTPHPSNISDLHNLLRTPPLVIQKSNQLGYV